MFKTLYKLVVHINPEWELVFTPVGICMIVFPILFSFLFYCVVNGFPAFAKLSKKIHWILMMILSITSIAIVSYIIANSYLIDGEFFIILPFIILNVFLSSIIYFISSLVFKRWSLHSLYIPFKWTPFFNNK